MGVKLNQIEVLGRRRSLRIYWGDDDDCPNWNGTGQPGYHNAHKKLEDVYGKPKDIAKSIERAYVGPLEVKKTADSIGYETESKYYPLEMWPSECDGCKTPVPSLDPKDNDPDTAWNEIKVHYNFFDDTLYSSSNGKMNPGDYVYYEHHPDFCSWSNCNGMHLHIMLPNFHEFDVMSRASNCDRIDDDEHRCWIIEQGPPNITVGKSGKTCGAGGGSVQYGSLHVFIKNGEIIDC